MNKSQSGSKSMKFLEHLSEKYHFSLFSILKFSFDYCISDSGNWIQRLNPTGFHSRSQTQSRSQFKFQVQIQFQSLYENSDFKFLSRSGLKIWIPIRGQNTNSNLARDSCPDPHQIWIWILELFLISYLDSHSLMCDYFSFFSFLFFLLSPKLPKWREKNFRSILDFLQNLKTPISIAQKTTKEIYFFDIKKDKREVKLNIDDQSDFCF